MLKDQIDSYQFDAFPTSECPPPASLLQTIKTELPPKNHLLQAATSLPCVQAVERGDDPEAQGVLDQNP